MAKPQSTTGGRARKNRRNDAGCSVATDSEGILRQDGELASTLEDAIEIERAHLTQAQSMLGCLHAALLSAEQEHRHHSGSADVVAMVLRLLRQVTVRLDAVYLQPFIDALRAGSLRRRRRAASARR